MNEERTLLDELNKLEENDNIESVEEPVDNVTEKLLNIESDIFRNVEINDLPIKKKNKHIHKILLSVSAVVTAVSIVLLSFYCIISDILNSNINDFMDTKTDFAVDMLNKPSNETEVYADDNGKYTVEGLAMIVKPQIVEIYTYENKNDEQASGSGSGIVISQDGYIVTNTHVLTGMDKYVVKTHDGKTYNAVISGRDAKTDIAVIKIEARGLIPAQFGNSDEVVQGESVVVIGNPAGLNGSITDGIVSGLNRKIKTDETGFEMNCIQTNAAISPGNSGGALVNMYGQVIGITSSKYAATTTEGLGFAITINEAKPIIEELVNQGYVSGRVKIGITFYSNYADYMKFMFEEEFGFEIPEELENAIWIEKISKDCDISNTELKEDDFIIGIEGIRVNGYDQLNKIIKGKKAGDVVTAKCARVSEDGKVSYFDIEFKLMPDTSGDY